MTPRTPGTAPTTARVRAFFAAIQPGNGETIRRRLRLGMPVDITQDGEGYTPLHVAALRAADDVVAVLLECGATVDAMTARGDSVLNSAAYGGHAGLMKLLLDAGASVHGMPGVRALASSIRRKHHDAARRCTSRWSCSGGRRRSPGGSSRGTNAIVKRAVARCNELVVAKRATQPKPSPQV